MYANFGEFISKKRVEKKITLRKMADMLGVSAPFLTDVEKDRRNPDIGAPNSAPEPISKSPSRMLLYEVVFQAGLYYHYIRIHLPRKNALFG